MKSNIILILLVLLCIVGGVFVYQRVSVLEARYETLKESNIRLQHYQPITANQIKERQFKEEMYIRQQERDTTLILGVFGFFSVIVGFFTFRSVRDEFFNKLNEINKSNATAKADIDNKYIEIAHKYKFLENEFNLDLAETYVKRGGEHLSENTSLYIFYRLKAVANYIKALANPLNDSLLLQESLQKKLNLHLSNCISIQISIDKNPVYHYFVPIENVSEAKDLISFITDYLMTNDWDLYKEFSKTLCNLKFENKGE